jgi:hypothetical protein
MVEVGGQSNLLMLPPDLHNSTPGEMWWKKVSIFSPKATFFEGVAVVFAHHFATT